MNNNEEAISLKEQGDDHFKEGKYDIAIKNYNEALKIDSDYINAWNNLGFAYSKIGQKDEAQKCKDKIEILKAQKKEQKILKSQSSRIVPSTEKSVGVATILSVIYPGLGQVYNGDIKKGFFILVEFLLGFISFIIPGIIVWLYSIYDSNKIAHEMNAGTIPKKASNFGQFLIYISISLIILVIALIGFGLLISSFESDSALISGIFLVIFFAIFIIYVASKKEISSTSEAIQGDSNQQFVQENNGSITRQETAVPKSQYFPGGMHQIETEIVTTPIAGKPGLNWAGLGQTIIIGDYSIQNALTYWSIMSSSFEEASCIDTRKPIGNPSIVEPLPYWPKYSVLNPNQRAYYLSWLSRGKIGDIDEIGYVFLYFYGLERRVLVDRSDSEIIFKECLRLLSTFSNSKSFNSYASEFVAYLMGLNLLDIDSHELCQYIPAFDNLSPKMVDVVLSWHLNKKMSVPWDLAYSIAMHSSKTVKTTIIKKSPDILKILFKSKFLEHYPNGLHLNEITTQKRLGYHPASPTLISVFSNPVAGGIIPEINIQMPELDQFDEIISIWIECVEELKPVSNKLNKTNGVVTREVYTAFPNELKKYYSHPDKKIWLDLLALKESSDGVTLVKVSDLAPLLEIEKRDILTPKLSKSLEDTARDVGLTIIPNVFVNGTSYRWNDTIALLQNSDPNNQLSENIEKVALIFEMAYAIATHDGNYSSSEQDFLFNSLTDRFQLNPVDIDYLKILQKVLGIQSPPVTRIGKRLTSHLDINQKLTLARFLSKIISLENKSEKEEKKILKTVYKSLNIETSLAEASITQFINEVYREEPVSVSKPKITRTGEVIPAEIPKAGITIDEMKLRQKIQETNDVKAILGNIFTFEEEDEINHDFSDELTKRVQNGQFQNSINDTHLPFPVDSLNNLDSKYIPILQDILDSKEISKEEFTNLVRKHNLMPQAVLDEINTWADEELGDFLLIEHGNGFRINGNF